MRQTILNDGFDYLYFDYSYFDKTSYFKYKFYKYTLITNLTNDILYIITGLMF